MDLVLASGVFFTGLGGFPAAEDEATDTGSLLVPDKGKLSVLQVGIRALFRPALAAERALTSCNER